MRSFLMARSGDEELDEAVVVNIGKTFGDVAAAWRGLWSGARVTTASDGGERGEI